MSASKSSPPTEPAYRKGTVVSAYRLEAFIGAGGMAEVYRARHQTLDKLVAIKFLSTKHARKPEVLARFMREGRFASQLRHPNVVEVMDVGEHDGVPYLVMEFLDGEPLSALIEREAPIEPDAIARILIPVAAAVAAAHGSGVIHRDLKPDNIFLAETSVGETQPKVLDFGISKSMDEDATKALTTTEGFVGTPSYLSPEQASGDEPSSQSDQYSLGVVLYELACGRRPYDKGQRLTRLLHTISTGKFAPPREHRADIPEAFEELILRTLHLEPEKRFPSVLALANALVPFADERTRAVWGTRLRKQEEKAETTTEKERSRREVTTGGAGATAATRAETTAPDSPGRSRLRWVMALVAVALVALVGRELSNSGADEPAAPTRSSAPRESASPASFHVFVEVVPATAELLLDGERAAAGRLDISLERDGQAHRLEVRAEGYLSQQFNFRDAPPPARIELQASAMPAPTTSASATTSTAAPVAKPKPAPRQPQPKPTVVAPPPTFSSHPDNVDPWAQ